MDRLEEIKNRTFSTGRGDIFQLLDDYDWMIKEIETLRLDNTYLQQRLQREVEEK